jgi:hypothetical protein
MWKFIKLLIGLSLFPFCRAVSMAVYRLHRESLATDLTSGWEVWAFPAGFLIWVLIFFLLPRPFRTYVLGHELTHALWGLMMGSRIGKIKVGRSGGHVELSKTNFIIALAPYFFPFYTFIVIAAYYLTGLSYDVETHQAWWFGAVGLTWAFHVTFTLHMLTREQPDIQQHGKIFSYCVIYIMNLLLAGVWMIAVGTPQTDAFAELLAHETVAAYTATFELILAGWDVLSAFIAENA